MAAQSSRETSREQQLKQALVAWRQWWDSLSPAKRKQMIDEKLVIMKRDKETGQLEPVFVQDSFKVAGHAPHEEKDAAEHHRASKDFDFRKLDDAVSLLMEQFDLPLAKARRIAVWHNDAVKLAERKAGVREIGRLAGPLIREDNPKVSIAGLCYALDMDALNGMGSMRKYAEGINVSPEAISKKKRFWQRELDLQAGPHGKTDRARRALSDSQKVNHRLKKKYRKTQPQ